MQGGLTARAHIARSGARWQPALHYVQRCTLLHACSIVPALVWRSALLAVPVRLRSDTLKGDTVVELIFSGLSPYVRKVNIVAHEHGLADRLRLTAVNTRAEPEKITPYNPLGKIPVL